MRAYTPGDEEALYARRCLKDWAGGGLVTDEQRRRMERDADCSLRRTNGFLRAVLFFFTLVAVIAATWLFFLVFFSRRVAPDERSCGVFLLMFAAGCYAFAEIAISKGRLYRYGIEEALSVLSVAFLCIGLLSVLSHRAGPK